MATTQIATGPITHCGCHRRVLRDLGGSCDPLTGTPPHEPRVRGAQATARGSRSRWGVSGAPPEPPLASPTSSASTKTAAACRSPWRVPGLEKAGRECPARPDTMQPLRSAQPYLHSTTLRRTLITGPGFPWLELGKDRGGWAAVPPGSWAGLPACEAPLPSAPWPAAAPAPAPRGLPAAL
jgi:hypothetical protein